MILARAEQTSRLEERKSPLPKVAQWGLGLALMLGAQPWREKESDKASAPASKIAGAKHGTSYRVKLS